jgi:hypothetical protein
MWPSPSPAKIVFHTHKVSASPRTLYPSDPSLFPLPLLQGVLDVAGSSPRRFLFQVLQHFDDKEMEKERLAYFATCEGRDDLYR